MVNNDLIVPFKIDSRDAYFLSKLFCEKILQTSNCKYIILRPHNIYGPRMGFSHVIPELIKRFRKKINKVKIYSPEHTRAFCYIDDAINQIIELSFNKKINNMIFNIGNQKEEIKIYSLAKKIQKILKIKNIINKGTVTKGSPKRRVPDMTFTLSKIKSNTFIKLEDGLLKTVKWYLNEEN
jgi:nucleoside-diphosphate-sugar epimerase